MDRWLSIAEQLLRAEAQVMFYALLGIAAITLLECMIPAEAGQGWGGRGRNIVYLLQLKVLGILAIGLWYAQAPAIAGLDIYATSLPPALLVMANLLAIDVLYYVYHRAQHRFHFLWAIHELHHADAELNATSSYRTFWLEAPVQLILVFTPTLLLFGSLGREHHLIVLGFSLFFLIFSHANLRLRLGPLTGWVIGPQVHRIHHSRLPGHRDCNFAQYFPFLDRLFGTFYAPAPDEFPPTGAEDLASDASLWTALTQPFRVWFSRG